MVMGDRNVHKLKKLPPFCRAGDNPRSNPGRISTLENFNCEELKSSRRQLEKRLMNEKKSMQRGMIGLGRMGANMARRLIKNGHECVVFDRSQNAITDLVDENASGTRSLMDFVKKLNKPRVIWPMVPAGVVDTTISDLTPLLDRGDILIDGGNSYYVDDIRRARELASKGIHFDEGVPVPGLTTALYERFSSRGEADYQDKLLSAMRFGFGGHLEKTGEKTL
jgi:6-phosphogluconate dehydrogenase